MSKPGIQDAQYNYYRNIIEKNLVNYNLKNFGLLKN